MIEQLLTEHLDTWTQAVETRSAAGRGSSKKLKLHGIAKLRELILELAVRGQLVPQDESDEPASVLLERIAAERERLVKEKKIKKPKKLPEISGDEKRFEFPVGWEGVRFNDVVDQRYPISYGVLVPGADVAGGVPLVRIGDLSIQNPEANPEKKISPSIDAKYERTRLEGGEILMAVVGSIGKLGVVPASWKGANIARALCRIKPSSVIYDKYILMILQSDFMQKSFKGDTRTLAQPTLNIGLIRETVTPIPPYQEQKRIVAKVDELMALCDALESEQESSFAAHEVLVENLLAALTNAADKGEFKQAWARVAEHFDTLFTTEWSVDQLKQTILQLAVMGKLVEQDPADEPAGVLLKRIAAEKARLVKEKKIKKQKALPEILEEEKAFELPVGWEWVRLADFMQPDRDISYGIIKLGTEQENGGIPTLRCSDVRPRRLDLQGVKKVSPSIEAEYQRTRLVGGEVLVNIRGTLGGVALVPKELAGYNIAREVAMLPINGELDGKFLVNLIASPFFWSMIEENLKGIAYKGLNLSTLRSMAIAIPPAKEQKRISEKVEELMLICERLNLLIKKSHTIQRGLAEVLTERAV